MDESNDLGEISMQGNMFIVVAPSGAGKTSLVEALLKTDDKKR
jgi:guanylate kinase